MSETLNQREASMRDVLRHVQDQKPIRELTQEQLKLLKDCCDAHYVEGIATATMISGRVIAEYHQDVRITLEGLRFLEPEPPLQSMGKPSPAREALSIASDLASVSDKIGPIAALLGKLLKHLSDIIR